MDEKQEFLKALEQTADNVSFKIGSSVSGKILQFDESDVFIDFGYKSEGKVKRSEFFKEPVIGETIEVKIMGQDDSGYVLVSKLALERIHSQEIIDRASETGEAIKGIVKEAIKGGFNVSIGGNLAFCPFSLIDMARGTKEEDHIGKEYDFRIIKRKGKGIVLSRRVLQEESQNCDIDSFLNSLKEGDIIQGKVKNIERFGAFAEITPGLDGFIALNNMAWEKVHQPKNLLLKGEERMFKVLSIDKDRKRVDLGVKQLDDDPWGKFIELYRVGDVVQGEVTNVKKFGAFVKVYDGVEGLVHISDLSWNTHVQNPTDFAKKGTYLECKILEINVPERKLSLGLKQVKENPWDTLMSTFPPKKTVQCVCKRILKNFAVFELPNGLEGICEISDFDWKNNIVNIKDYVKEGDTLNMVVMFIDREKQKIKLSYKHTTESPWKVFEKSNPVGSIIQGVVKVILEAGAVITLPDDLEGFVHISQVDMPNGANIEDYLKVGETYPFVVKEVNQNKHRISLSRRDYLEAESKKEMKSYITKDEANSLTFNYFDDLDKN